MKIINKGILGAGVMLIACVASAQLNSSVLDTSKLHLVPRDKVPSSGTFWVEGPNGMTAPLPCPPANAPDAPIYALPDGQFLVDARESLVYAISTISQFTPEFSQQVDPLDALPMGSPMTISSNIWFSQIITSNHTFVSLNATVLAPDGTVMKHQFPSGVMFPVTTTNLTVPLAQWQPVGPTNSIGNSNFSLPYNPAGGAHSFYSICALLNTNIYPAEFLPFTITMKNISILTDVGVTLMWTNSQPGQAAESDAIVEMDANGHAYLVNSVITTGASGSLSFELSSTNGLSFVRYSALAASPGDQFFLPTNYFNNPDVVTVPYLIDTNSGREIVEVAAYDVTDPQNVQFLGQVTGLGSQKGTLEIPGVSIWPGVDTIEFRAIDSNNGQTTTDITVTNNRLVSIVSPILTLRPDGTNRIAADSGGYGIALELVTTATSGTWVINVYRPDGSLYGQTTAPVASIGQHIIFDDGGTESTVYPDPYYDIEATVNPPGAQPATQSDPPSSVETKTIRVYLLPPRSNAGSITAYDDQVLPSSSGDRQFVLDTMQNGESEVSDFIYYPINIQSGHYTVANSAVAFDLNQPFSWLALQSVLSGASYYRYTGSGTVTEQADRPMSFIALEGHGFATPANPDSIIGIAGPGGWAYSQVTQSSLQDFGFDKSSNAVAIAIFTGCRLGNSSFMQFILRNRGVTGQIASSTAAAKHIRPCFGLGWTTDTFIGTDQFQWVSYWCLFAAYLGGSGSSPFQYSLDQAIDQATFYDSQIGGSAGDNVIWSGTQGKYLDQFAQ